MVNLHFRRWTIAPQLVDSFDAEGYALARKSAGILRLARFRSIPLIFTVFAILTHNPAHGRVCRSLENARIALCVHVHRHTRLCGWWPTRSEHLFRRIRPAGFHLPFSVFVYRLPAANRRVKNDARTSREEAVPDVGREKRSRENGRRLLFVREAEISEIRSLFTFESEQPRGFGNRYLGLRGKMYR